MFTRYQCHEDIRSYQTDNPRPCKRILSYDANVLYLSTMLKDMPCEKKKVVHYTDEWTAEAAALLTQSVKEETWFGFAEVDIEIPFRCVHSLTTKKSLSKLCHNRC